LQRQQEKEEEEEGEENSAVVNKVQSQNKAYVTAHFSFFPKDEVVVR
jgi:hypothetical protein